MKELGNGLNELKSVELDILKSFVDCCQQLNLHYYLMDGTMLGAVRHKGFIPWDDDIDVGMMRKDYDVFIHNAPKFLPPYYFLQTIESDQEYLNNFAKIRDSRTTFIESSQKERNINHGVFIDIFPLDFFPEKKPQQFLFKLKNRLLSLRIRKEYTLPNELRKSPQKERIQNILCKILCLVYPDVKKALERRDRLLKSVKSSQLICNLCGGYGYKAIVPYSWFSDISLCRFEDLDVSVPIGFKEYLEAIYGDYMALPPKDKRTPHHYAELIDVSKSYKYFKIKGGRINESTNT